MRIKEAEEYVETLTREQLLALTDRVIRAVADRGYFGDKIALDEIDRLVSGSDQRETPSIKRGDRLFPNVNADMQDIFDVPDKEAYQE